MKKKWLLPVLACLAFPVSAQNIQLHYDFGKDRGFITTTVEMFKLDRLGSTFFFIDMDYGRPLNRNVSMAYWEIARSFKLPKTPLAAHLEYNGGLGIYPGTSGIEGYRIDNAWLAGPEFVYNTADFSRGFTLMALYKYIQNKKAHSYQLTGVWYLNLLQNKFSFSGFADFWREETAFFDGSEETENYVFMTEPQLWYNINKNLSLGSELEIAMNFAGVRGWRANPTLGIKWTF